MIKTSELNLIVQCENCEELQANGSEVVSSVPLRDIQSGDNYSMEFRVKNTSDGNKQIDLLHLYNGNDNDQLQSMNDSVLDRLQQLVDRILEGGVCGNIPQCPKSIQSMSPSEK